ncbi:hypothetical protein A8950_2437 [Dongia mobilis]|uniref:CENP-V/GFA domain-containing protein n=1 Tax=Dongia mobilis TaxID=578943 RepID=A0A4R6WPH4_9PROT|nr:GFA family protein [Dongia mobilis]TDQ81369.1 hypothetical protein A8950_2437 [Dongia mobilis]
MSEGFLTGRCACGAFRYCFDPTGAVTDYCHCETCRRWSGAPVTAWAQVPRDRFEILAGTTKTFRSSPAAERHFCPECGSPVYMSGGDTIGIMLGTVDDASGLSPTAHGFETARLAWLHIEDGLPRWPKAPPYDEK